MCQSGSHFLLSFFWLYRKKNIHQNSKSCSTRRLNYIKSESTDQINRITSLNHVFDETSTSNLFSFKNVDKSKLAKKRSKTPDSQPLNKAKATKSNNYDSISFVSKKWKPPLSAHKMARPVAKTVTHKLDLTKAKGQSLRHKASSHSMICNDFEKTEKNDLQLLLLNSKDEFKNQKTRQKSTHQNFKTTKNHRTFKIVYNDIQPDPSLASSSGHRQQIVNAINSNFTQSLKSNSHSKHETTKNQNLSNKNYDTKSEIIKPISIQYNDTNFKTSTTNLRQKNSFKLKHHNTRSIIEKYSNSTQPIISKSNETHVEFLNNFNKTMNIRPQISRGPTVKIKQHQTDLYHRHDSDEGISSSTETNINLNVNSNTIQKETQQDSNNLALPVRQPKTALQQIQNTSKLDTPTNILTHKISKSQSIAYRQRKPGTYDSSTRIAKIRRYKSQDLIEPNHFKHQHQNNSKVSSQNRLSLSNQNTQHNLTSNINSSPYKFKREKSFSYLSTSNSNQFSPPPKTKDTNFPATSQILTQNGSPVIIRSQNQTLPNYETVSVNTLEKTKTSHHHFNSSPTKPEQLVNALPAKNILHDTKTNKTKNLLKNLDDKNNKNNLKNNNDDDEKNDNNDKTIEVNEIPNIQDIIHTFSNIKRDLNPIETHHQHQLGSQSPKSLKSEIVPTQVNNNNNTTKSTKKLQKPEKESDNEIFSTTSDIIRINYRKSSLKNDIKDLKIQPTETNTHVNLRKPSQTETSLGEQDKTNNNASMKIKHLKRQTKSVNYGLERHPDLLNSHLDIPIDGTAT